MQTFFSNNISTALWLCVDFFLQKLPKNKPQLFLFENNVHLNSPKVAIYFSLKNATRIFQKSPNLVTLQSAITIYETKREKNRNIDSL